MDIWNEDIVATVPLQTLKLDLMENSCCPAVLSASNYSTFTETSDDFNLRQ